MSDENMNLSDMPRPMQLEYNYSCTAVTHACLFGHT